MRKNLFLILTLFLNSVCFSQNGINPFGSEGREDAVQFTIGDTVYVGLGRNADNVAYDDFWKYSYATNKWDSIERFPGGVRTSATAFTIDSIGYVGLGYGNDYTNMKKDFYSYNPKNDTWTQVADFGGIARCSAISFAIGEIAIVGSGEESNDQLQDFWKYDSKTNSWVETSAFSGGKRSASSSFIYNDKGYVIGGFYTVSGLITPYGDIHEYDTLTDNWVEIIDYDYNIADSYYATTFVYENKAYICYGGNKKIIEYNPLTNELKNYEDLLTLGSSRYNPISFVLGDSAYFGLGRIQSGPGYCMSDIKRIKFPKNPSDILLSDSIVSEYPSIYSSYLSDITVIDESVNSSHFTELFDDENYPDNASFYISFFDYDLNSNLNHYDPSKEYKIRIKATNNYGLSFDKEFIITVEEDSTINNIISIKSTDEVFRIFPNPVNSVLFIIPYDKNLDVKNIEVYQISGQKVLEKKDSMEIDFSNIQSGIYYLKIYSQDQTFVKRIVVK